MHIEVSKSGEDYGWFIVEYFSDFIFNNEDSAQEDGELYLEGLKSGNMSKWITVRSKNYKFPDSLSSDNDCTLCGGCGEGLADGVPCSRCKGTGLNNKIEN